MSLPGRDIADDVLIIGRLSNVNVMTMPMAHRNLDEWYKDTILGVMFSPLCAFSFLFEVALSLLTLPIALLHFSKSL